MLYAGILFSMKTLMKLSQLINPNSKPLRINALHQKLDKEYINL